MEHTRLSELFHFSKIIPASRLQGGDRQNQIVQDVIGAVHSVVSD